MKGFNWKNPLLLLLTAFIWGSAFVAQSVGMDSMGPLTFSCVRSIIGSIVLIPCIFVLDRWRSPQERERIAHMDRKLLLLGGVSCGVVLCLAVNLQQLGIQYTSVGKAVLIALTGFYLLCMTGGFSLECGDVYLLCCSVLFSCHILVIDHFSPLVDGVRMSCIQLLVSSVLSGIEMLLFETPTIEGILVGAGSVLTGWIVLHQKLSVRELGGCVLIFIAVILAQLPEKAKA